MLIISARRMSKNFPTRIFLYLKYNLLDLIEQERVGLCCEEFVVKGKMYSIKRESTLLSNESLRKPS